MTDTRTPEVIVLPANQPDIRASRAAFIEHARILASIALQADLRDVVRQVWTPDLICTRRTWSREVGEAARARVEAGDFPNTAEGWRDALGTPESVELSEDGSYFESGSWCSCVERPGDVYVERWTTVGRTFHGWVCGGCRRLTQTG